MTDGFGDSGGGWVGAGQQFANWAVGTAAAASVTANSPPILGFVVKVIFGGGFQDQSDAGGSYSGNDPFTDTWNSDSFTGSSHADPFTTEAYESGFLTGTGSIAGVISVGDDPAMGETSSDVGPDFAAPAADDDPRLASNDPQQWRLIYDGQNFRFAPPLGDGPGQISPSLPDASIQNFLPPSPSTSASQTPAATGQPTPTPPVTPSAGGPAVPDYNPTAWINAPNVYVPPSPPPIDTWPTAGLSAPPVTSSSPTLTSPANAATPSPPVLPQAAAAPQDFWSRWFGDATQVEPKWTAIPAPAPDRRLMQPITHYDTGNRPINYLLNKIVFPLFNLGGFQWYYNYNMIPLLGLSDLLEQAKSSDPLLAQWASDTFPLEGAMGVTMEIGPALDWASAWAYTALRESAISPNSPFWLIMGGIGGGSSLKLGTLAEVIEVGGQTGTAAIEGSAQEISAARALIERITHQPATDAMIRDFLMFRNAYNEERASMELNGISFEGFDEYIVPGGDVNIGMLRGSRAADFAAANELAGIDSLPPEYVWHHHPDFGRLVAIDRDIHELLRHWGGVSIWKHLFGVDYP